MKLIQTNLFKTMKKLAFLFILVSLAAFSQKKGKWQSLSNGKDFTGWHSYNKAGQQVSDLWKIEDGAFVLTGKGGGDLVTDKDYENFTLELEWKIAEGGNSGIFYGVKEDAKYKTPYMTGPEIQVLDDERHPDSKAGKNGNHKAGSLYDMIPPAKLDAVKPAGQWNKCVITKKDNQVTVVLNGVQTVSYPASGAEWDAMVANSKFKGWEGFGKYQTGKIGLQDHGDKVWFRNIRIKEL